MIRTVANVFPYLYVSKFTISSVTHYKLVKDHVNLSLKGEQYGKLLRYNQLLRIASKYLICFLFVKIITCIKTINFAIVATYDLRNAYCRNMFCYNSWLMPYRRIHIVVFIYSYKYAYLNVCGVFIYNIYVNTCLSIMYTYMYMFGYVCISYLRYRNNKTMASPGHIIPNSLYS